MDIDLIGPTSMRSIRVVGKARWRVPGNSGQFLPISTARAINRRCADRSRSRVDWWMPPGSRKPLAHAARDEMLDLPGGNTQGGGAFRADLG
jgi:hypothetical protein